MAKKISDFLIDEQQESWTGKIVNNAPLIIGWFSNIVVVIADVRAYDVVYNLTGSVWKALSASLACAIPFVLWEIGWQYNHTTEGWRKGSLFMAGVAFATSIFLGVADYLNFDGKYWTDILLGGVVVLTGVHTVVGFLYYYNDPDVARRRRKAQALASMEDREMNAKVAEQLLANGSSLLEQIDALKQRFDPEEVDKILDLLRGKVSKKQSDVVSYASEIKNPTKPPR
jgi:hypothetical protein